jgi:hypothetical protein
MTTDIIKAILLEQIPSQGRATAFYDFLNQTQVTDYDFLLQLSGAPRKLGRQVLPYTAEQLKQLNEFEPTLGELTAGNLGRVLLAIRCPNPSALHEVLLRGDDFEKAAVLTALSFRKDAADYHLDVVNVCRTNSLDTYQAIAINNPYPSRYFTDPEFNQMVLKVTFLGLAFEQIFDLEKRFNPELGKSLRFLYDERTSAGRTLPEACLTFMKEKNLI